MSLTPNESDNENYPLQHNISVTTPNQLIKKKSRLSSLSPLYSNSSVSGIFTLLFNI